MVVLIDSTKDKKKLLYAYQLSTKPMIRGNTTGDLS